HRPSLESLFLGGVVRPAPLKKRLNMMEASAIVLAVSPVRTIPGLLWSKYLCERNGTDRSLDTQSVKRPLKRQL
nr:hypothetical protein [Tanacetum cinerariifolium]